MKTFFAWLGYFWMLPITVLGVLALLASGWMRAGMNLPGGVVVAVPRSMWWLPKRFVAVTLGAIIMVRANPELVLAHELVHVRQCKTFGPFLLVLYPLASVWAWISTGSPYQENYFESQARKESKQ